jgi:hypothetical protein
VAWLHLLQELLEMVHGRPRLMLAAAGSNHGTRHVGAICSLAIATITVGRGCSLLKSLLASLPASLGTLPGVLGGDFG